MPKLTINISKQSQQVHLQDKESIIHVYHETAWLTKHSLLKSGKCSHDKLLLAITISIEEDNTSPLHIAKITGTIQLRFDSTTNW